MMHFRTRGIMAGLIVGLMSSTAAHAADGEAFAQRLKTLLAPQGVTAQLYGRLGKRQRCRPAGRVDRQ